MTAPRAEMPAMVLRNVRAAVLLARGPVSVAELGAIFGVRTGADMDRLRAIVGVLLISRQIDGAGIEARDPSSCEPVTEMVVRPGWLAAIRARAESCERMDCHPRQPCGECRGGCP